MDSIDNSDKAFGDDGCLITGENPFALFRDWLELANKSEINDANAMALATADGSGLPNVRMVLLKDFDEDGFVFYTNSESQKGVELEVNMQAAVVLHWKSLRRQVRLRGTVTLISEDESNAYFNSRPRASRIGAWASQQSRPVESRLALQKAVAVQSARFAVGSIPRPSYWNGYRITPSYIEFWLDKPFRLHDRLIFQRETLMERWTTKKLFP